MRIHLSVNNQSVTAILADTDTARDFASLLPLTLTMSDLLGREKPGALPRALTVGRAQATYRAGDLGYWSPNYDLAIYYREDGQLIPAPGIVIIGHIDSGLSAIADAGDNFPLIITALD